MHNKQSHKSVALTADQQEKLDDLLGAYSSLWYHIQDSLIMTARPTECVFLLQQLYCRSRVGLSATQNDVEVYNLFTLILLITQLSEDYYNIEGLRRELEETGYKLPSPAD